MEFIRRLNESFSRGILPPELDFSKKENQEVLDLEKVRYNTFYKTPEYVLQRFPNGKAFLNLPGGVEILQQMADNMSSPLEEMLERQSIQENISCNPIDSINKDEQQNGLDGSRKSSAEQIGSAPVPEIVLQIAETAEGSFR